MRARCFLALLLVTVGKSMPAQSPNGSFKLGHVEFANTCSAAAQPSFNRAVALLHSFEFRDAIDGFGQTLKADPACGMAYWGIALSEWGNPFAQGAKTVLQLQRGHAAVDLARSTGSTSEREKGYVAAVGHLFDNHETVPQAVRVKAYATAMADLAAKLPRDDEALIFSALSLASSADPADKQYGNLRRAGEILESLVAKYPNHPGIAHYIIHSYDVPALAPRARRAAQRYSEIAPSAPHALHMPSHTFTRVGEWRESIKANRASVEAARRARSPGEELHASDYMMYAYLQRRQLSAARGVLDGIPAIVSRFDPAQTTGAAPASAAFFAMAAIPARYALERGAWAEAARLEARPSPVPWANAMTHFARAIGAARIGDTTLATTETEKLAVIRDTLLARRESYWAEQSDIQFLAATAWLALARGQPETALMKMREATDRELATEKSAVTPGPLAPANELLGEMLLQLNRPGDALPEFESTLKREPNRFRSMDGALKAATASGHRAAVRKYRALVSSAAQI